MNPTHRIRVQSQVAQLKASGEQCLISPVCKFSRSRHSYVNSSVEATDLRATTRHPPSSIMQLGTRASTPEGSISIAWGKVGERSSSPDTGVLLAAKIIKEVHPGGIVDGFWRRAGRDAFAMVER